MIQINSIHTLNLLLQSNKIQSLVAQPLFIFITGASGSGKTFLTQGLEQVLDSQYIQVAYFDSIGVPTPQDMIDTYGSGEKWQEATTHLWIQQLLLEKNKALIILEGQYNPQFALDACKKFNIASFLFIDVHAERSIRERRLIEQRNQPDLVSEDMNTWAEFLKQKTLDVGGHIVDSSESNRGQNINEIAHLIDKKLGVLKSG